MWLKFAKWPKFANHENLPRGSNLKLDTNVKALEPPLTEVWNLKEIWDTEIAVFAIDRRSHWENWIEIYTCIEAKTTRTEMLIESEHEMWKTDIENKNETEIENKNEKKTNDTVLGRLTCTVEVLSEFLFARLNFLRGL